MRKSTNELLKEWTTATDPTLGAELWGGIRAGMSKRDLKALYPTITDYGHLDKNGQSLSVEMRKDVASKVRLNYGAMPTRSLMDMLNRQYGRAVAGKCITASLCEGMWRANSQVDVYLSITGDITYQLASDEPPVGFRP
jgi:hypothetical protein